MIRKRQSRATGRNRKRAIPILSSRRKVAPWLAEVGVTFGSLSERFWSKVRKGGRDECWIFTGQIRNGYGRLPQRIGPRYENRMRRMAAHRLAYVLTYGPVPLDQLVLHECDNPPCCNPSHLHLGDHGKNMGEMAERDRSAHGSANGKVELTENQVVQIRRERRNRTPTPLKTLADRYGVDLTTVDYAARGVTWARLDEPVATKKKRSPFSVECPQCRARPDKPCRAVKAFGPGRPVGTILTRPHPKRQRV